VDACIRAGASLHIGSVLMYIFAGRKCIPDILHFSSISGVDPSSLSTLHIELPRN
jgi:hypothetical protein